MSSLTGQQPKNTYKSLLKLESNDVSGGYKRVTDGGGQNTSVRISTTRLEANKLDIVNPIQLTSPDTILTYDTATKEVGITPKNLLITNNNFTGIYDSGWKQMPTYNTSSGYGVVTINNQPLLPYIRCIGKTVFLKGDIWIPNTDTNYFSISNDKTYITGTNVLNVSDNYLSLAPIVIPSLSNYIDDINFPEESRLRRVHNIIDVTTPVYQILLRGRVAFSFKQDEVRIYSLIGLERGVDANYLTLPSLGEYHTERIITNKVVQGRDIESFSTYETNSIMSNSQRIVTGFNHAHRDSVDLNSATDWAGSFLRLDGLYFTFKEDTPQSNIENFFNTL